MTSIPASAITTLSWEPTGELHADQRITELLERLKSPSLSISPVSEIEVTSRMRMAYSSIEALRNWRDCGILTTASEIKSMNDAIKDVADELITFLMQLSAEHPSVQA